MPKCFLKALTLTKDTWSNHQALKCSDYSSSAELTSIIVLVCTYSTSLLVIFTKMITQIHIYFGCDLFIIVITEFNLEPYYVFKFKYNYIFIYRPQLVLHDYSSCIFKTMKISTSSHNDLCLMHKSPTAANNSPPPAFYIHFLYMVALKRAGSCSDPYVPACIGRDGQVTSLSQG